MAALRMICRWSLLYNAILFIASVSDVNCIYDSSVSTQRPDKYKQRVDLKPVDIHGYDEGSATRRPVVVYDSRNRLVPGNSIIRNEGRSGGGHVIVSGYSRVRGTASRRVEDEANQGGDGQQGPTFSGPEPANENSRSQDSDLIGRSFDHIDNDVHSYDIVHGDSIYSSDRKRKAEESFYNEEDDYYVRHNYEDFEDSPSNRQEIAVHIANSRKDYNYDSNNRVDTDGRSTNNINRNRDPLNKNPAENNFSSIWSRNAGQYGPNLGSHSNNRDNAPHNRNGHRGGTGSSNNISGRRRGSNSSNSYRTGHDRDFPDNSSGSSSSGNGHQGNISTDRKPFDNPSLGTSRGNRGSFPMHHNSFPSLSNDRTGDVSNRVASHQQPLKCPAPNGLFPHPTECNKYLQCAYSKVFVRDCGPGTVFNPLISNCDWPYNVVCAPQRPITTQPPTHGGVAIDFPEQGRHAGPQGRSPSFNWGTSWLGERGKSPTIHSTGLIDSLFDMASDVTSYAVDKIRDTASTVVGGVSDALDEMDWGVIRAKDKGRRLLNKIGLETETLCPKPYGQFPYFKDCSKFLNCWRGRPHLEKCLPNLLFNGATGTCDWPSRVICPSPRVVIGMDGQSPFVVVAPPTGQQVRLRGANTPSAGYVQVWMAGGGGGRRTGEWGLVTDKPGYWTRQDGDVICRQLGYIRGSAIVSQGRLFGLLPSDGVAMASPECEGTEQSLLHCQQTEQTINKHDLNTAVAGVRCIPNTISECEEGGQRWGEKCYYIATQPNTDSVQTAAGRAAPLLMNHSDGKHYCLQQEKTLVAITSQAENDFLSELLAASPYDTEGYHTAGVRAPLLGDYIWLWQNSGLPPGPRLQPFTKWWTGWNSTGTRDNTAVYSLSEAAHQRTTLCVLLRETFPTRSSRDVANNNVHADYYWWQLGNCEEKLGVVCQSKPKEIGCIVGLGVSYRGTANTTSTGSSCVQPPESSPLTHSTEYYDSMFISTSDEGRASGRGRGSATTRQRTSAFGMHTARGRASTINRNSGRNRSRNMSRGRHSRSIATRGNSGRSRTTNNYRRPTTTTGKRSSAASLATIQKSSPNFPSSFYCRNIDGEDMPYCYVESGVTEYCDIARCDDQLEVTEPGYPDCGAGKFACPDSDICVYDEWLCDGNQDCVDGADEESCRDYSAEFSASLQEARLLGHEVEKWLYTPYVTCASRCAQAKTMICKAFNYEPSTETCVLCDGVAGEVGGLVKQEGWEYHERESYTLPPQLCDKTCSDGRCYLNNQTCDGRRDCREGEDEVGCDGRVDFALRLVNGSARHEGRLEVRVLGRWGSVCDDLWDLPDGDVVCRQLGYPLGAREVHGGGRFGSPGLFLMDDVNCGGSETGLQYCDFAGWGEHDCNNEETASVTCARPGDSCLTSAQYRCTNNRCVHHNLLCDGIDDCYDGSDEADQLCQSPVVLRLVGRRIDGRGEVSSVGDRSPNHLPGGEIEGRVEVRFKGVWGTVCDDDFGMEEGHVVCRAVGQGGAAVIYKNNTFGPGSGKIWLDDMRCLGHEESLELCSHRGWGLSNCDHSEDVGVRCSPPGTNVRFPVVSGGSSLSPAPAASPTMDGVLPHQCGTRSVEDRPITLTESPRVVGGYTPRAGAHPWMVGVRVRTSTGSMHWCGGSVLSQDFVLTAAHCLAYGPSTYIIRVGDFDSEETESLEKDFLVDKIMKHPQFDRGPFYNNDIAVMKVKRRNGQGITFSERVQPLCLADNNFEYPAGLNCTVAGWGAVGYDMGFSQTLMSTNLPIISESVCRSDRVFGNTRLSDGMFCAGHLEGGIDTCQGDSGGPLVCYLHGRFSAVGITSWGHGCARPNKPGVYTRLTAYMQWLYTILRPA